MPTVKSISAWVEIGGQRFFSRSKAEVKFARYLQFLKDNKSISAWEYEPHTFWFEGIKRGVCSYKPDFKVIENDGRHWWAEVKGYMDSKSKTKIKRFAKYFPEEKLKVFDSKWVSMNNSKLKGLVKGWE